MFGKLFGSDSAIDKTIDTAGRLLDEAFYTKEEAAIDRAEARKQAQGLVVEWLQATTGSRLARRMIAVSITSTWLFLFLLSSAFSVIAVFLSQTKATVLIAATSALDIRIDQMTPAVMLILGFYFAAPYMGDIAKGALEKFGNKNSQ